MVIIKLNYKILAAVLAALLLTAFLFTGRALCDIGSSDKIRVPIIMYHEVRKDKSGVNAITPYEFESDLKFLKENGYTTVTMSDLIDYVYDGIPLPEKPIVLTFDDGYLNTYVYAYPLLKKYEMKIVLSIIGVCTDRFSDVDDPNLDYAHATWNDINEMIGSGLVEIQNHTYNLHTITKTRTGSAKKKGESLSDYEKLLTDDIGSFQQLIFEKTGVAPSTFTYPYGTVCSDSVKILKRLGFKASLTTYGDINVITRDEDCLFCLNRYNRPHGKSLKSVMENLDKRKK